MPSPLTSDARANGPSVERTFDANDHRLRGSPGASSYGRVQNAVVPQAEPSPFVPRRRSLE